MAPQSESALIGADAADGGGLDRIAGREPSPELVAQVIDEYRRLCDGLRTEALRQVLDPRLEGFTREGWSRLPPSAGPVSLFSFACSGFLVKRPVAEWWPPLVT